GLQQRLPKFCSWGRFPPAQRFFRLRAGAPLEFQAAQLGVDHFFKKQALDGRSQLPRPFCGHWVRFAITKALECEEKSPIPHGDDLSSHLGGHSVGQLALGRCRSGRGCNGRARYPAEKNYLPETTHSISTREPFGNAETSTVERAG